VSAADGIKRLEQRAELFAKTRVGLAAGCVVAAFAVGWFGHRPAQPSIPVRESHTLDSLGFTAPIFRAHVDSTIRAETVYVAKSVAAATHASSAYDSSTFYKHLADSLTAVAGKAIDTSAVTWEGIAVVRTAEAVTARHAADSLRVALTDMTIAKGNADDRATTDSLRVVSVTDALNRTAADLAKSDPPCRWLLGIAHCQTRKKVATEAAIGSALAVKYGPDVVKALVHLLKP